MNNTQKRKFLYLLSIIILLSIAVSLVLYALKTNINLFYTPTQLLTAPQQPNGEVRIGGYVKKGSTHYDTQGATVHFIITDAKHEIHIKYPGVLPNLFRDGQGVVVTAKRINTSLFLASEVLAKHDEKYMPLAITPALKHRS